jgi:hypothetical protein
MVIAPRMSSRKSLASCSCINRGGAMWIREAKVGAQFNRTSGAGVVWLQGLCGYRGCVATGVVWLQGVLLFGCSGARLDVIGDRSPPRI